MKKRVLRMALKKERKGNEKLSSVSVVNWTKRNTYHNNKNEYDEVKRFISEAYIHTHFCVIFIKYRDTAK